MTSIVKKTDINNKKSNMNYLDIDFPQELSYCFAGGAEFCTSLATAKNKQEVRNDNWQEPRFKYNLLYKYCSNAVYDKLQSFFFICKGQKYSFNFLDTNDNTIISQIIGIADGEKDKFEIFKTYSYGIHSFNRKIYKTKNEKIFIDRELIDAKKYSISNGILTFQNNYIPTNGSIITISATFFVVVRFCNDFLPIISNNKFSKELPDITLLEVQQ